MKCAAARCIPPRRSPSAAADAQVPEGWTHAGQRAPPLAAKLCPLDFQIFQLAQLRDLHGAQGDQSVHVYSVASLASLAADRRAEAQQGSGSSSTSTARQTATECICPATPCLLR